MELVGLVARRQRHRVELGHVPAFDNVAAAAGVIPQRLNQQGHLVDPLRGLAIAAIALIDEHRPIGPLLAIDRSQIAPARGEAGVGDDPRREILAGNRLASFPAVASQRPVGPDLDTLGAERANVGLASKEPEELAACGFPVDSLGRQQRDLPVGKVETQLGPEQRTGAHAGAIDPLVALLPDAAHQLEILPFIVVWRRIGGTVRERCHPGTIAAHPPAAKPRSTISRA